MAGLQRLASNPCGPCSSGLISRLPRASRRSPAVTAERVRDEREAARGPVLEDGQEELDRDLKPASHLLGGESRVDSDPTARGRGGGEGCSPGWPPGAEEGPSEAGKEDGITCREGGGGRARLWIWAWGVGVPGKAVEVGAGHRTCFRQDAGPEGSILCRDQLKQSAPVSERYRPGLQAWLDPGALSGTC